jgi:imidazole glycerol-phosphate synthase subunit HisF
MSHLRLVARLDVKAPNLVKGVRLEGLRVVGSPSEHAARYAAEGADEIHYQDIVASLYGRSSIEYLVSETASEVFIPLMVGGGLRSVDDVRSMLRAGADRVSLNTAVFADPSIIGQCAEVFGVQCVCVAIEAVRDGSTWEAMADCGREHTGRDAVDWAEEVVSLGAGEIMLTSIDRDGTKAGFDLSLLNEVLERVDVPVVIHGGAWTVDHLVAASEAGASGVAIASMVHLGGHTFDGIKRELAERGVVVRA